MDRPAWAKDGPEKPRRRKPAPTVFNRCPDRDVSLPQTAQGGTAARCAADLSPAQLRLLADVWRDQRGRERGLAPADYVRSLIGFEVTAAEREWVNRACEGL